MLKVALIKVKTYKSSQAKSSPPGVISARADGAARSSGFISSIPKSSTATSGSIKVDLAFGAGTDVENGRLDSRPFNTAIGRYDRADL